MKLIPRTMHRSALSSGFPAGRVMCRSLASSVHPRFISGASETIFHRLPRIQFPTRLRRTDVPRTRYRWQKNTGRNIWSTRAPTGLSLMQNRVLRELWGVSALTISCIWYLRNRATVTSFVSHPIIVRATTTFRRNPRDDLIWVHDVTRFAVHAVREVDAQFPSRVAYRFNHFVHSRRTKILAGIPIFTYTPVAADVQVRHHQMHRLILL